MKTFNPEITKGPWEMERAFDDDDDDETFQIDQVESYCGDAMDFLPIVLRKKDPNAKAIAAVPELLEVYKCAKDFIEFKSLLFTAADYDSCLNKLEIAIETLEERHGVES